MRRFPIFTALLVVLNLLVYFLELETSSEGFCQVFGLVPVRYIHTGNVTPLISSLFLHDPNNVWHLVGNVAFLGVLGALVESYLGHIGFLALYLIAGVAGGLMHVSIDPSSTAPLVGASGAIFGLLAVAVVLRPRLIGFAVAFVAINVWHAFTGGDGSTSFACHIGGFAAGTVIALFIRLIGVEEMSEAS